MGKHILTATNITANPINNSVAEYASVDIQYIGSNALNNPTANNDTEINRTIYERLHLQSSQLEQPKPTSQHNNQTTKKTSKSSKNNTTSSSSNNTSTSSNKGSIIMQQHHQQRQHQPPSSYNLGNYFPRVSSEPTSRKNYQTPSSRERDLKVKRILFYAGYKLFTPGYYLLCDFLFYTIQDINFVGYIKPFYFLFYIIQRIFSSLQTEEGVF